MTEEDVSWHLAVTKRCQDDDLRVSGDWRDHVATDSVLGAFVERLTQVPHLPDRIQNLVDVIAPPVFSLHVGQARAATWHDEEEDIVWLLAVAPAHDYDYFPRLAIASALLPIALDYEQVDTWPRDPSFFERLATEARELVARAQGMPGALLEREIHGGIAVRVCREEGEPPLLTVAVSSRLAGRSERLPPDWQLAVATAFFPRVEFSEVIMFSQTVDNSAIRADELVMQHFMPDVL